MMKRLTLFTLPVVFLLLTAVVFGAGETEGQATTGELAEMGFQERGLPITTARTTLKVAGVLPPVTTKPLNDFEKVQWLQETTNIEIDWVGLSGQERQAKVNIMFAGGDLPDLFLPHVIDSTQRQTFLADDLLVELGPLIDKYGPNIKKVFEKYPAAEFACRETDGRLFTTPQVNPWDSNFWLPSGVTGINKQWLDKLGLDMPETTEDLYNVLKAFKEKDPNGNGKADEIPYLCRVGDMNTLQGLLHPFGVTTVSGGWMVKNGKVYNAYTSGEFKEALKWIGKLLAEGLLPRDMLTLQNNEMLSRQRMNPRIAGIIYGWAIANILGDESYLEKEYVFLPPQRLPTAEPFAGVRVDVNFNANNCAIPTSNPYPEIAMRWLDHLYDERVNIEIAWGPIDWITDTTFRMQDTPPGGMAAAFRNNTVTPKNIWPAAYLAAEYTVTGAPTGVGERTLYGLMLKPFAPRENFPVSLIQKSAEEGQIVQQYGTDVNEYINRKIAEFIYEGGIDAGWDEYVATLKKMGIDKVRQVQQNVYDRFKTGLGGSTAPR